MYVRDVPLFCWPARSGGRILLCTRCCIKECLLLNVTLVLRSFIWAWLCPAPTETTWLCFFFSPLPLKAIRALSGDVLRSGLKASVLKGIDEVNYLFYDEQTRPAHSRTVCRKLCSFPGHATERTSAHSSDIYSDHTGLLGCYCGLPL